MNYDKPKEVSDVLLAFPGSLGDLLPPESEIPDEFRSQVNPYVRLVNKLFFEGLPRWPEVKEGIDAEMAHRHIATCLRSFEPKHQHKEAGVAFLLSKWFTQESVEALL